MPLKLLGLTLLLLTGYRLRLEWTKVHRDMAALTVFVSVVLHQMVQLIVPHEKLDELASGRSTYVLVFVSLVETLGLWLPVVVLPWTAVRTRAWVALYIAAAAMIGTAGYYFPFDVIVVNGEIERAVHPDYYESMVVSLIFITVGWLLHKLVRRTRPLT